MSRPGAGGLSRRGLLVAGATGVGLVGLTTVGQTVSPLSGLALFAAREPGAGPQGLAINRTAGAAGVTDHVKDPGYRLEVAGNRPLQLTVAELEGLDTVEVSLPIACVEGWSRQAHWRGVPLRALLSRAGAPAGSRVRVHSLEQHGPYRTSIVNAAQADRAVLATHLNGERLSVDHGYPMRLIAPNRPGVLQTKWLHRIETL